MTVFVRCIIALVFSTILGGCATVESPLPEAFNGPIAFISDSAKRKGSGAAGFFYVASIDGRAQANIRGRSIGLSSGQGNQLTIAGVDRPVAAMAQNITLVAESYRVVPLFQMANSAVRAEGTLSFVPITGANYVVKGFATKGYAAAWIENSLNQRVSDVIEAGEANTRLVPPERAADTSGRPDRSTLFEHLTPGEAVSSVVRKLGEPDGIVFDWGNVWSQRAATSTSRYLGLGDITTGGGAVIRTKSNPERPTYDWTPDELREALASEQSDILVEVGDKLVQSKVLDAALLDVVAERIWQDRDARDSARTRPLEGLCKGLVAGGSLRYRDFFRAIRKAARSPRLREAARKALLKMGPIEHPAEQFQAPR